MRNFMLLFFAVCFVTNGYAQTNRNKDLRVQQDQPLAWLGKWLDAWELVRKDILQLPPDPVPDMLFFDEQYVYTNSTVSAPQGILFKGPDFSGKPVAWRKVAHQGELTMPDGQQAPVAIMSFAAPRADGKPFFVMAAPSLWEKMGVASYTLKSGDMLTGVFIHEFSHTRQFNGFGVQIDSFEQTDIFKELAIDDDIIQELFEKDSVYTQQFLPEIQAFYDAAFAKDKTGTKRLAVVAMAMLKKRQQTYFVKGNAVLKKPEAIFLSMEGMGQYAAVAWLMHPKGGRLSFETAVNGFRRKRRSWSQEEGLAMFLVLNKLSKPNWNKVMFGTNPTDIIQLLKNALP